MRHAVITFAVLAMCLGTAWAERPPIVSPTSDEQALFDYSVGSGEVLRGVGPGMQGGADHIVGLQCVPGCDGELDGPDDAGWRWPHGGCPANTNITGPIGSGVLYAYSFTGDPDHLTSATRAGEHMRECVRFGDLTPAFATFDPYFLMNMGGIYSTHAEVGFFDALTAGTYRVPDEDTAGYIARVQAGRAGTYINLLPWEFSTLVTTAATIGNATSGPVDFVSQRVRFRDAVLAGLNTLDSTKTSDILGLAGAVRGLALDGTTSFPAIVSPAHSAINGMTTLCQLADILVAYQNSDGSWSWSSTLQNPVDPTDKDTQTTAYAVMALLEADVHCTDYSTQIAKGRDWLRSMQLPGGGFLSYPGGGENVEVEAEALNALAPDTCTDNKLMFVVPAESLCVKSGDTVTVELWQRNLTVPVRGFQAWAQFDSSVLTNTGHTLTATPYPLHILNNVTANNIDLAAGVNYGDPAVPTPANYKLADLTFTAGATQGPTVVSFRYGDPPSRFTRENGTELTPCLVESPTILIDNTAPAITCPSNATVECDESSEPGPSITIDGVIGSGEWAGAQVITVAAGKGTVSVIADADNLYVLLDINDTTDARKGENSHGNDQTSININPTDGGPWGFPYDLIFQTGADPAAWGGGNSGFTDGWYTQWKVFNVVQPLPTGVQTKTSYNPTRVSEWKIPLAEFSASLGDELLLGGAVDIGDGSSYAYPVGLDWSDADTFAAFQTWHTGTATATDNLDDNPAITYTDVWTPNPGCTYTGSIARTWKAEDCAGNFSTCVQTITVNDVTDPVIACPANVTIECDESTDPLDTGVTLVIPFDVDPVLSPTQAPGVWYTDRYAPYGFVRSFFDGDDRLMHSINASDAQTVPNQFYNTQGRKYDLASGTTRMTIDLYVPAYWATTGRRMAGFWGTGFDSTAAVSAYPIIEFTSLTTEGSGLPRFRAYDSNTGFWTDLGLPSGFAYDAWSTLEIELVGTNWVYKVGNLQWAFADPYSVEIGNVILQGHNTTTGVTYDIYWDNFVASETVQATDNCDPAPVITYSDAWTPNPGCTYTGTIARTWTATDCAGNASSCVQTITVNDVTAPDATAGSIAACYPDVASAETAAIAATSATDNCAAGGQLTKTASTVGTCSATITVRVTDCATNYDEVTYNTRIDNTPPVITCPPDVTVNADAGTCSATLPIGCFGDVTFNPSYYATHFDNVYDLTSGDLILTYSVDLSGVTQTVPYETPYVEVGLREVGAADFNPGPFNTYQGGKGGWMTSLVADLATNPNLWDMDDKHNLGASGGRGESDYDVYASDPTVVAAPPFGSFNTQYIWFDRDDSDPWQDKKGANSGGTYDIRIQYHAITPGLGSMIATINGNGIDTVYQKFLVGGTYYPAGLSFKGDMTQMQVFAGAYWTGGAAGSVAVKNICVNRPLVSDNCDPNPVITWVRSDGKPLTDPYPSGTTTITWTATDNCGNSASCVQTVTVNAFNEMVVSVELSPTMVTPLTRCITFDLWKCPGTSPAATVSAELLFTSGLAANQVVLVPCSGGPYTCITARDTLHTLRRTDDTPTIVGTQYTADFTGDPASGGDWLIGGNLNDDKWIDILDFGVFSWQYATTPGANTTCSTGYPHADISGDGAVTTADFTFIQTNFLKSHEANCCGVSGFRGEAGPITRISVAELVAQGLGELAAGDINGDGWLDEDDMDLFGSNLPPAVLRGDANCDGVINFADINPFVQAVSSPAAWEQEYPNCNPLNGDINGDGFVDFQDINAFVALLTSGG